MILRDMKKIAVGKKYRNLHTGRICEVVNIIFSTVAHLDDGEPRNRHPHYTHYKTFRKHWVEIDEDE